MKAYQYSILRYRRSKSAGELVNIGLVMAVPADADVYHFITPRYQRLSQFFEDFDGQGYKTMVDELRRHFGEVLESEESTPRQLALPDTLVTRVETEPRLEDLRPQLVSDPESCFQWSGIMSGVHPEPEKRFEELCEEFILRHEPGGSQRERLDDQDLKKRVTSHFNNSPYRDRIEFGKRLQGPHNFAHDFPVAWQSESLQLVDGLSFDYLNKRTIENKVAQWRGTLVTLAEHQNFEFTGVVAPPSTSGLDDAYRDAVMLIDEMEQTRNLVRTDEIEELDREIAGDFA